MKWVVTVVAVCALSACGRFSFGWLDGDDSDDTPLDAPEIDAPAPDAPPVPTQEVAVVSASCSSVASGYDCNRAWFALGSALEGWFGTGTCNCDGVTTCLASTIADLGTTRSVVALVAYPQQAEEMSVYTSVDNMTWAFELHVDDGAVGDPMTAGQAGYGLGAQIGGKLLYLPGGAVSARYVRLDMAVNWCAFVGETDGRIYEPQ